MTVCIMARAEEGSVVCASDSAINLSSNRLTSSHIKGFFLMNQFVMHAGGLAEAQRVSRSTEIDVESAIEELEWDEVGEEDSPEFLVYDPTAAPHDIYSIDVHRAKVIHQDWGAIGHGSDAARMLLEALYKKKSVTYVESTLKTIIGIIQKYDATVYGPVRTHVL